MGFIYKITNNFDDKIYIGLTTKSKAIERWYQHRYLARHLSNTDKSYLHRAMALHGVDNFSFEVIEEVSNELLPEREQYWIHPEARDKCSKRMIEQNNNPEYRQHTLDGYKQFCQNNPGYFSGENNPFYGKHHTEESLQKIKNAAKKRQKSIQQLDKDTLEIIATYDGVKEAEASLQVSHGWLSKAARQNKVAYGYRWKFIESVTTNSSPEISTGRSGEPNS